MAHFLEHMAFKGSSSIGSKDPEKEKQALQHLESAYQKLRNARRTHQPPEIIQPLEEEFLQWKQKAQEYAETNEFGMIINLNGGVGLNAFTNADSTQYFYSLPSNRLELWAYLESERFADPVMREFYQERDVVLEERRLRNESSPTGKLYEVFVGTAFHAHPYGRPVIGFRSDLEDLSATEAEHFFRTFYGAKNLVIAVVGQVDPEEVYRFARKHLSKIPPGSDPPGVVTREPFLRVEKTVVLYEKAQPVLYIGYPVPEFAHPDRPALELLSIILSSGRSSILYSELVKKRKLVSSVSTSFTPGNKYPRLFTISAFPLKGVSPQEVISAIDEIFATLTPG
ncbi:MAG: M16 family metallopeptidase, partial [bacterium]